MADDDIVTLQSLDNQEFKVEVKVAKMSTTIDTLIEDAGIDNPIPLPNVNGNILSKVVEYCKHHTLYPKQAGGEDEEKKKDDTIDPWDLEFCGVDKEQLFQLVLAANYLDIKDLLDLTCKIVANMIKGKTQDEIRAVFGIENDFTPEEEEQIRKENEWCEER